MSCVDIAYTGQHGLYASVRPITDVPAPVVTAPHGLGWDPLPAPEFHITVAYNATVQIPRERVEEWVRANRVEETTVFKAAAIGNPQWWVNEGKVYLGIEAYSPELFGLHESLKAFGVTSSFPAYKCHLTYGKWRGIPEGLTRDRIFMNEFVKQSVKAEVPNIIETSLLKITNAKT